MRRGAYLPLFAAAAITLSGSLPVMATGPAVISASAGCERHQLSCPALTISVAFRGATITADQFVTMSVVVTNNGLAAASVPDGALLFRTTFSHEIGYGRSDAPPGYGCSDSAAPVTSIECARTTSAGATGSDHTIAAGDNRTFSFRVTAPSDVKHPSST